MLGWLVYWWNFNFNLNLPSRDDGPIKIRHIGYRLDAKQWNIYFSIFMLLDWFAGFIFSWGRLYLTMHAHHVSAHLEMSCCCFVFFKDQAAQQNWTTQESLTAYKAGEVGVTADCRLRYNWTGGSLKVSWSSQQWEDCWRGENSVSSCFCFTV